MPRAITVDKNPAYTIAIHELKNDRILPQNVSLRGSVAKILMKDCFVAKVKNLRFCLRECKLNYYIL